MDRKTKAILEILGINVEGKELTKEEMGEVFRRFREVKKAISDYEKSTLKPLFFKGAESFGTVTKNGGYRVELEDGYGWEKQARVKVTVDEEKALQLLKEKNLLEYIEQRKYIHEEKMDLVIKFLEQSGREDLIEVEEHVPESYLEQAYLNEQITDSELGSIIKRKVTYALVEVKPSKK